MNHKLEQARRRVREAIALAARPSAQSLEQAAPALEEAVAVMRQAGASSEASRFPETARLHAALRRDLELLRALFEQAARIVGGWAKIRACLAAGYTPAGDSAALDAAPRIVIRG